MNDLQVEALPVPTAADTRAIITKYLPLPVIGSAPPPTATPLVNVQIITWVKSDNGEIALGSATLLGQKVQFRGQIRKVDWNFGDGSTDTSDGPGRAYDFQTNPCTTPICPGYFGHVYRSRGTVTITATATWFAQFRVGGGAWQDVGLVQGRIGRLNITIHSARAILVGH